MDMQMTLFYSRNARVGGRTESEVEKLVDFSPSRTHTRKKATKTSRLAAQNINTQHTDIHEASFFFHIFVLSFPKSPRPPSELLDI